MFEYNKDAWNNKKVPYEIKKEFFEKFRDLCAYYGVIICNGEIECPKYLRRKNSNEMISAIFFEFYDGSSYNWSDGELNYSHCNSFENEKNEDDTIIINGVDY